MNGKDLLTKVDWSNRSEFGHTAAYTKSPQVELPNPPLGSSPATRDSRALNLTRANHDAALPTHAFQPCDRDKT